jgi:hypothetical protein
LSEVFIVTPLSLFLYIKANQWLYHAVAVENSRIVSTASEGFMEATGLTIASCLYYIKSG